MNRLLTVAFFTACFFGLVLASAFFDHLSGIGIARWKYYAIPAFALSAGIWVFASSRRGNR